MAFTPLVLLATLQFATAHFGLEYPQWRFDTLSEEGEKLYSQWDYPCAGVPLGAPGANRTDWSTTGGSLTLDLHHPWTYVYVNLGLGANVTNFNYTLTPGDIWNITGNGTLCVEKLELPASLTPADGQLATIQVVTGGASGSALYNCADITFKTNVKAFGGETCTTTSTIKAEVITGGANGTTAGSQTKPNAATVDRVSSLALTVIVGLAVGMSFA